MRRGFFFVVDLPGQGINGGGGAWPGPSAPAGLHLPVPGGPGSAARRRRCCCPCHTGLPTLPLPSPRVVVVAVEGGLFLGVEQVVEVDPVVERRVAAVDHGGDECDRGLAVGDRIGQEAVKCVASEFKEPADGQVVLCADLGEGGGAQEDQVTVEVLGADVAVERDARGVEVSEGGFVPIAECRIGQAVDRQAGTDVRIGGDGVLDARAGQVVCCGNSCGRRCARRRAWPGR